ncbi:MAG: hypothetical protein J7496_03930 [Novosphingobium sp.]|nr:hypothetical protein [Novosphingobium sp.]MBO9601642.1 hypothetical protein [Novosphingobium sp.]
MVDDNDYLEGYVQGFAAVMGASRPLPPVPPQPATRPGRTPFQMGLMEGISKGFLRKGMDAPEFFKTVIPVQPAEPLRRRTAR